MRYVIQKNDGSVGIMHMVDNRKPNEDGSPLPPLDPMSEVAKFNPVDRDSVVAVYEIDHKDIPTDKSFRDAWVFKGGKLDHDLVKAKEIALKRIRDVREPLLTKLDGLQLRAQDLNDDEVLNDIKIRKQALRDATLALKILNPTSIDEIKAATPNVETIANG